MMAVSMMTVRITVTEPLRLWDYRSDRPRAYAEWSGQIGWPTVPRPGVDNWAHCGEWAPERIHQTYFHGPPVIDGDFPPLEPWITVEIEAEADVIVHLIAEHGFTGGHS